MTEILHTNLDMPERLVYFGDPMLAISKYKRNNIHESKRAEGLPPGYGLDVVHKILFRGA